MLNLARLTLDFLGGWQLAMATAAARERDLVQAQLDALQAQVNPHFLFNSLNTIYGVIAEDPARAQALLLKLAEVFRYALRHGRTQLVPLSEELSFVAAFAELLEVRHGDGLVIERRLTGDEPELWVPPMTLQLLIENAVKHNRIDGGDALHVVIEHDEDRLRVHHAPRPRLTASAGEGRGLKNIAERFALAGAAGVAVRSSPERFEVEVPLLRRR
jgi:LytS/YehU family sensor histidine kinase